MRLFFTLFWIVLVFIVIGIFIINVGQPVKIDLFFNVYEQVDIATVAFSTLLIGFVFGTLLFSFYLIKEKKIQSLLKKQIKFLQTEIRKTANAPELIDAEIVEIEEEEEEEEESKNEDDKDK